MIKHIFCFIHLKKTLLKTGVKSVGKVAYVTVILPYFLLISLLFASYQLPGAARGILYFIKPDWAKIFTLKVWVSFLNSFSKRNICVLHIVKCNV